MITKFENYNTEKTPFDNMFANPESSEMKIYNIKTWKYLLWENDMRVGKIVGYENSIPTTKLDMIDDEYSKHGYKPDWYKYLNLRFIVELNDGSQQSWHIKKVLPLARERYLKLGGELN